ncbi:putative protoheme IX biogenesis protein [Kingella potus]|uniref:Putative protoheme IX biogenesis protein n=1 Tax=Kingella potus TaxID=265175 RepID=A0A377R6B6_9NEIS|nr:heme biosynthesis HemY N-terminal domain-containing protein [Kingella potus]STR03105.1 putative protoheme IX biogenesis protein [Kingella potus]
MKALVWILILFAAAVGLSVASTMFSGNVYFQIGATLARVDLKLFVPALILVVVLFYILVQFFGGLAGIPARLQRFGTARRSRKAGSSLNAAGLAYFEGRYQKAEQEAAKVLKNKEAGEIRALALMIAAHAADRMNDAGLRGRYLEEISELPAERQLSRYLLLAEDALNRRDYPAAEANLDAAAKISPRLTRLLRLQLRYAFDHGDTEAVLDKTAELEKQHAANENEAAQYRDWAYRRLLAGATDSDGLKRVLKRIPDTLKSGVLCAAVAEKYENLGLYEAAAAWVGKYYPQNGQAALLPPFVQSVVYLDDKAQRKAVDAAEGWLQERPKDADLLVSLGLLAYGKQLWGKAQGYLEAGIAERDTPQARLALAKVFDQTGNAAGAENQRLQALALAHQDTDA